MAAPQGSGSYQQGDPGFGDIRIGGYNFGTTSLAMAFMPPPVNNYSVAGDIAFNTAQVFNNGGTYDLTTVAAHEIGHALGLYHSGISSAEMYSSYNGAKGSLSTDDIAGIQSIYGGVRTVDQYEGTSGDDSYNTAYNINSLINTSNLTALVSDADITTTNDRDYYVLNVPSGTNGTMTVKMQSQGLSLLEPQLTVYNASQGSVGSVNGTNYGDTVSVTVTGVTAGQHYFIQAFTPVPTAVGTGKYAMSMTFGANPTPTVPLPNTTEPNGSPLSSGGGQAVRYNIETLVNTTTQNTQTESPYNAHSVAMDANGNYVVVWQSHSQDGSGQGIYAQRFNVNGQKVGGELRVNSFTTGEQSYPTVAMDSTGDFVVAWQSLNQDGSGWGVYAQRYNNQGVARGSEFRVNKFTTGDQQKPNVAMDSNGDFVIAWQSLNQDGGGWGVYAQRYNNQGVAQGTEFLVNTTTAGSQQYASAGMNATGNFVIAWQSYNQDATQSRGIYAQRYNYQGVAQGEEFRVNTTTAGDQTGPGVGMNFAGTFTIAWCSNGQDGSGQGVILRTLKLPPPRNPSVSTMIWRFRPVIFLPPSYPRPSAISVALTVWLSMLPALGLGSFPTATRTIRRRASRISCQVPSDRHCRK